MSLVLVSRLTCISLALTGLLVLTGCTTPPQQPVAALPPPSTQPEELSQTRFERVVQELLEIEPSLTALLDQFTGAMDKPTQVAVERDLLQLFSGPTFTDALQTGQALTPGTILQQFTPASAAAIRTAGLEKPLYDIINGLIRLSPAIAEMATQSDDGRSLERVFELVRRDVLPAVVEIRALITEQILDENEAGALAQKLEEQLQSINEQLGSLKTRARSVSTPPSL